MGKRALPTGSGDEPGTAGESVAATGRRETELEKTDRNWTDLLQELRVMQTGIQILTGFLLTLPFQQRFPDLSAVQVTVYLCLVVLSVLITALLMSTVVMHRTFFQRRIKPELVRNSDLLLRITVAFVGLILIGTLGLVFDLVLGAGSGTAAALGLAVILVLLWVVLPLGIRRRAVHRQQNKAP